MKIKTYIPEDLTVEAVCQAYELDLISRPEARAMIRRIWGIDTFLSEEK